MSCRVLVALLQSVLMLFAAGCSEPETPTVPTADPSPAPAINEETLEVPADASADATPIDATATPQGEITLTEIDGEGLKAAIAAHQGQVVLVDMWATWCIPCRERFPHVVELSRTHADEGLSVISLSIDDPAEREAVLEFLTEQAATFENFIGTYGLGTEATDAFEYGGEVPFYKLYDRTGELRHQFSGDPRDNIESVESMDQRIAELLAE